MNPIYGELVLSLLLCRIIAWGKSCEKATNINARVISLYRTEICDSMKCAFVRLIKSPLLFVGFAQRGKEAIYRYQWRVRGLTLKSLKSSQEDRV